MNDLMSFKGYAIAEVGGSDREEAIHNAFEFMDAHSFNRKKPAAERYEVIEVRNLSHVPGLNWWGVRYRRRSPQSRSARAAATGPAPVTAETPRPHEGSVLHPGQRVSARTDESRKPAEGSRAGPP